MSTQSGNGYPSSIQNNRNASPRIGSVARSPSTAPFHTPVEERDGRAAGPAERGNDAPLEAEEPEGGVHLPQGPAAPLLAEDAQSPVLMHRHQLPGVRDPALGGITEAPEVGNAVGTGTVGGYCLQIREIQTTKKRNKYVQIRQIIETAYNRYICGLIAGSLGLSVVLSGGTGGLGRPPEPQ